MMNKNTMQQNDDIFAPTKFNKEEEFWGHKHFNKCNRKENLAKEEENYTTIFFLKKIQVKKNNTKM